MDKKTVGIIIKNDYDDILYHKNNFFVKIEMSKKDELRVILEDTLTEILEQKAFRIDKISKKIPASDLLKKGDNTENFVMYIVKVYMYSDNSKFLAKEDILDKLSISLEKDFYVKYIMRYNKYRNMLDSYVSMLIYLSWSVFIISFPHEIKSRFLFDTLFNNFWFAIIIYIALPIFILDKFIVPRILNNLLKYDISEKTIKISKWLYRIVIIIFCFGLLKDIWSR